MPRPRRQGFNETTVLRLAATVTVFAAVVVLTGGSALWLVEREQPDSTVHSYGDALWWALTTLTTTGYGDHIPMTTIGRVIGAGVMVTGVAVIGAVAAVIALALTVRFARQEELAVKAEAESLEHRLEIVVRGNSFDIKNEIGPLLFLGRENEVDGGDELPQ